MTAVADELEIRSLVHRYADAASRRDPAGAASTFTSDGEWHAPELGRHCEAPIAFFTSILDGWNVFLQGHSLAAAAGPLSRNTSTHTMRPHDPTCGYQPQNPSSPKLPSDASPSKESAKEMTHH